MSYKTGDWCCSPDGELYGDTFATREEAVAEATRLHGPGEVWIAQVGQIYTVGDAFSAAIDVDDLEERAAEWLCDDGGCVDDAADRIDIPVAEARELQRQLQDTVGKWARTGGFDKGIWYQVKNPESVKVEDK